MAVIKTNILSKCLGMPTNITAIIPTYNMNNDISLEDMYNPNKKMRVLWLLHGFAGDENDYLYYTNIVQYANKNNLAIIMPQAYNHGYSDDEKMGKYFEFVATELRLICSYLFPISLKREDNYIGGLSMGAAGAMKVALAYPQHYSKAFLLSGGAYIPSREGRIIKWFGEESYSYGGFLPGTTFDICNTKEDAFYMAKYNVDNNLPLPSFYISVGSDDFIIDRCRKSNEILQNLNYDVYYEEIEGYGHQWIFWDMKLKDIIRDWL